MAKLYVNPKVKKGHINPELQGHFSEHLGRCIYEGIFVGEDSDIPNVNGMRTDVVEALKEIRVPVLRWPGGCFADEYHWKDGIGPKEGRKKMINTHWGGVVEDNSFGTHEFMELCRQLGCKTYINGNLGSGTVQEMSEWVEYMTFDGVSPMADLRKENGHAEPWKVDYFGVGNESWGCGGNMRPEYYGDLYRRYQTYVRNYDAKRPIYKIACGANVDDYHWTDKVLETTFDHGNGFMNGMSLHYYTLPTGEWDKKGSALEFDEKGWYRTLKATLKMEELIRRHGAIMDQYDPEKKIGMIIDEWGIWCDVEPGTNPGFLYQQNTMRDALVAGLNLNLFNKNCDRVKMANIAQMVNVLQAVILTEGEKMAKTPTWHVFDLYKYHQDGELVESSIETREVGLEEAYRIPDLSESVSLGKDGRLHVTVTNASLTDPAEIEGCFAETTIKAVKGSILTGEMHAHNTFEEPDAVHAVEFTDCKVDGNKVCFTLPACSVLHLELEIA
ncbi:MAG: alpha-N-arabinofuranosidase [Blautia sp.]|nr:alpha-N-arabinofuranosidase [Blautia sp.]